MNREENARAERIRMARLRQPGPQGNHRMVNRRAAKRIDFQNFLIRHNLNATTFKHPTQTQMLAVQSNFEKACKHDLFKTLFQQFLFDNDLKSDLEFLDQTKKFAETRCDRLDRRMDGFSIFFEFVSMGDVEIRQDTRLRMQKLIGKGLPPRTFKESREEVKERVKLWFDRFRQTAVYTELLNIAL